MNTSEWPPTYLVSDCTLRSTPCASGLNSSPAAQVLSSSVSTPRSLARRAIAGTSCISKVSEPGLSITISRVAGVAIAITASGEASPAK